LRNNVEVASGTASAQGTYLFAVDGFTVGSHTLTATATDAAGNVSAFSAGLPIKVVPPGGFAASTGRDGAANDEGRSIAVDPAGNSYVAGTLGHADGFNDLISGNGDLLVASYGPGGGMRWQLPIVNPAADDRALGIAFAREGTADYIYVTGTFQGTLSLSPSVSLTSRGGGDIFILKLQAASGALVWARSLGGTTSFVDAGFAIAPGPGNTVVLVGQFAGTLGSSNITPPLARASRGGSDAFLLRLNADGSLRMLRTVGGAGDNTAKAVAVATSGDLYLAGSFSGAAGFDPNNGANAAAQRTSRGGGDAFLLKLTAAGAFGWAQTWGGTAGVRDEASAVALDQTNPNSPTIYAAGYFLGANVDFDPGPGVASRTSSGGADAFVLKLNVLGQYLWANTAGGSGDDRARGITVLPDQSVMAIGHFERTVDFNPAPALSSLTAASADAFLWAINMGGAFRSVQRLGSSGFELGRSLASDAAGNLLVTGQYSQTLPVNVWSITSLGARDAFVAKLTPPPPNIALAAALPPFSLPSASHDAFFAELEEEEY
jgi:hypothetical protein